MTASALAKPKILTGSKQIHALIKDLFSAKNAGCRRVIIVAFIGRDGASFIEHAEGVELYCWPKGGGTHPDAIYALSDAKATIYFAQGLHSKIYWVEGLGALITSANLSATALTSGAQHECGVFVDMAESDIDKIIANVKGSLVAENGSIVDVKALKKLQATHASFWANGSVRSKRDGKKPRARAGSFADWYAQRKSKPQWKCNFAEGSVFGIQPAARTHALEKYKTEEPHAHINGFKGDYRRGDSVLYFETSKRTLANFEWVLLDFYIKVGKDGRRSDCRYQGVQLRKLDPEQSLPFAIDNAFRAAIRRLFKERGGFGTRLGAADLKKLAGFYDEEATQ